MPEKRYERLMRHVTREHGERGFAKERTDSLGAAIAAKIRRPNPPAGGAAPPAPLPPGDGSSSGGAA